MYKDENFRKVNTHMLAPKGEHIPCKCYSYETRTKLFDIIVKDSDPSAFVIRTNSKKSDVRIAHHEIDKHFNLGLKL